MSVQSYGPLRASVPLGFDGRRQRVTTPRAGEMRSYVRGDTGRVIDLRRTRVRVRLVDAWQAEGDRYEVSWRMSPRRHAR